MFYKINRTITLPKGALESLETATIEIANSAYEKPTVQPIEDFTFLQRFESIIYYNSFVPTVRLQATECDVGTRVNLTFTFLRSTQIFMILYTIFGFLLQTTIFFWIIVRHIPIALPQFLPMVMVLLANILAVLGLQYESKQFLKEFSRIIAVTR